MRILQVLGTLAFGDAIGNHAVALKKILRDAGYSTEIYATYIDGRLRHGTAKQLHARFCPKPNDILIYHLSDGCSLNLRIKEWNCRKILMYHNITPPEFLEPYDGRQAAFLQEGLQQVVQLKHDVDYSIVMSEFSRQDLIKMGYPAEKIWVMPGYFIPFESYQKMPDVETMKKYGDGWVNLLFVGRLAPNKKQEDVIRSFTYYKKYINKNSRLLLVGSTTCAEYKEMLQQYISCLKVSDVYFLGHLGFTQLIALYQGASVFICMSEHEGFCVPLVEAMYFHVPIIAYRAGAVSETMGDSGILLNEKDPRIVAAWIDRLMTDRKLRETLLSGQIARLEYFQPQVVTKAFLNRLQQIMKKELLV